MRRFWRNDRGVTALEFSIIIPFVCIVLLGIVDAGLETMLDALLERGAAAACRIGVTVSVPAGTTRDQAIYNAVWQPVSVLLSSQSQLTVTTMTYPTFSDIGQPEPCLDDSYSKTGICSGSFVDVNGNGKWDSDMGTSGAGGYGTIVRYQVSIARPTFTGILGLLNIKLYSLQRTIITQNEPAASS
jgi:Flp pilus assembly pilin Flp